MYKNAIFASFYLLHFFVTLHCSQDAEPKQKNKLSAEQKKRYKPQHQKLSMHRTNTAPVLLAEAVTESKSKTDTLVMKKLVAIEEKFQQCLGAAHIEPKDAGVLPKLATIFSELEEFTSHLTRSDSLTFAPHLQNIKNQISLERLVRYKMHAPQKNMEWLLDNAHETNYGEAHLKVCDWLSDASSSAKNNEYIRIYFPKLTPAAQVAYLEPFLKHALATPSDYTITFNTLIAEAICAYKCEATSISDKSTEFIHRGSLLLHTLCSLDKTKLSQEQHKRVDAATATLYGCIYEQQSLTKNSALLETIIKAGFESPLHQFLTGKNSLYDQHMDMTNFFSLLEKNNNTLSGEICYKIGLFHEKHLVLNEDQPIDEEKKSRSVICTWYARSAKKGYPAGVDHYMPLALPESNIMKLAKILENACKANAKSIFNTAMRDLVYTYCISHHTEMLNLRDFDYKDFFKGLLKEYPTHLNTIKDPKEFFYTAYSYAFAAITYQSLNQDYTIDQPHILSLLKQTYQTHLAGETIRLNPIALMPQPVIGYFESIINESDDTTTVQQSPLDEAVAMATLMLLEHHRLGKYTNTLLIRKGLHYLLNQTNTEPNFDLWFEHNDLSTTKMNTLQLSLLLVLCHQTALEDFFKAASWLDTLPLQETKLVKILKDKLVQPFIQSPIAQQLSTIGLSDKPYAHRVIRLLFHCDFYQSTQKIEALTKLHKYYVAQNDHANVTNIRAALRAQIELNCKEKAEQQALAMQKAKQEIEETNRNQLYATLESGSSSVDDITTIKKTLKGDPNSCDFALLSSAYALDTNPSENQFDLVITSLEQARQCAVAKTENWTRYITPYVKETLWTKVTTQKNNEMQSDWSDRAYACLLNETTKTRDERMQLLEPGCYKNGFCTLLYAKYKAEELNATFAPHIITDWQKRDELYTLIRYAIMQGQRSVQAAQDLDRATVHAALTTVQDWINAGDLGAAILRTSLEKDIASKAQIIASALFLTNNNNEIVYDTSIDNLVIFAGEHTLITPLKSLASASDYVSDCAKIALFRLYFSKLPTWLNSNESFLKEESFVTDLLNTGAAVMQGMKQIKHKQSLQKHLAEFSKKAIAYNPNNAKLKKIHELVTKIIFLDPTQVT